MAGFLLFRLFFLFDMRKASIFLFMCITLIFSYTGTFAQDENIQKYPLKIIIDDLSNQKTGCIYRIDDQLYLPSGFFELAGLGKMHKDEDIILLQTSLDEKILIDNTYREITHGGYTTHFSGSFRQYGQELLFPVDILKAVLNNILGVDYCISLENLTLYLGKRQDRVIRISLSLYDNKAVVDVYYKGSGQYIARKNKNRIELTLLSGKIGIFTWKNDSYPFLNILSSKADDNKLYITMSDSNFTFRDSKVQSSNVIRVEMESSMIILPEKDEKQSENRQMPMQNIIIDPGHGGEDTGAIGYYNIKEKDITLSIALILKQMIEKYLGMNVILTRSRDDTVGLSSRADIANENNGDLFISIHANWSKYRQAKGFEVFYANTYATDDDSLLISQIENLSLTEEQLPKRGIAELDLVLWDLAQSEFLEESMEFSSIINDYAVKELNIINRGVKQAPFFVLMGVNMPAALVEIGFITNKNEAQIMQKREYQAKLANVVYLAVKEYRNRFNKRRGISESHYFEIIPAY